MSVSDMQRATARRSAPRYTDNTESNLNAAYRSVAAAASVKKALLHLSILWTGALCAVEVNATSEETVNNLGLPVRCSDPVKIAVIGGGISGAATLTFLSTLAAQSHKVHQAGGDAGDAEGLLCNTALHMDLYEAGAHLGGRLDHVLVAGGHVELGGESIESSNKYMREFIQMYKSDIEERASGEKSEELHTSGSESITKADERLVYNGEVLSPLKAVFLVMLRAVMTSTVHAWMKIYNLLEHRAPAPPGCCGSFRESSAAQRKYTTFDSGLALTDALALSSKLYTKFSSLVQRLVLSPGRALVESIIFAIYTQSTELQSLAGLVSLACAFRRQLDNDPPRRLVVEHLIVKFADRIYLNCKIDRIVQHADRGSREKHSHAFALESDSCEAFTHERLRNRRYDYVVLAAPLSRALRIFYQAEDGKLTELLTSYYKYQKVFVTVVQAKSIKSEAQLVQQFSTVVTTAPHSGFVGTFFVSQCGVIPGQHERLLVTCKLKSGRRLSDADLGILFDGIHLVERREWEAYPLLFPFSHTSTPDLPTNSPTATKFELAPGLFHVNAFEGVFSCMEGQAVAARNVAQLLLNSVELHPAEAQE